MTRGGEFHRRRNRYFGLCGLAASSHVLLNVKSVWLASNNQPARLVDDFRLDVVNATIDLLQLEARSAHYLRRSPVQNDANLMVGLQPR